MQQDRLTVIQGNLGELYEQLAGEERALIHAEEAGRVRIQQQIRATRELIQNFEQEFVQKLSQRIKREEMPELLAEEVITELVDEIEILKNLEKQENIQVLLQQILAELQKPEKTASAKLKVALPIIPNLVSYELEGDTENVMRRLFPTFLKAYDGLKALKKKPPAIGLSKQE